MKEKKMKKDKFYVVRKHIYGTIYMVNPYVYGAYTTTAKIFRFWSWNKNLRSQFVNLKICQKIYKNKSFYDIINKIE